MHAQMIYADSTNDGPEIGTLVVVVDRAKNLPNKKSTKQDPYCQGRLGKTCNKTKTDRRGGQTPRWDQELRFTVHDSPDYSVLKLSVFNDDKKTELIGDAWVDLKDVVIPGGGQNDRWQELECRKKYAGEVRIELTYYDSRPKIEKPAPRRGSARDMSADGTPVKRRPLPSNPASGNSTPSDQPRLHTTGPRQFGTPPLHHSNERIPTGQRRDTVSSASSQQIERRRPLPAMNGSHISQDRELHAPQPRVSYNPTLNDSSNPQHTPDFETNQYSEYNELQHYDHSVYDDRPLSQNQRFDQFEPAPRPLSFSRHHEDLSHPHQLQHSYSAPAPLGYDIPPTVAPLRRSVTESAGDLYCNPSGHYLDNSDPFGPDHPELQNQMEEDVYDPRYYNDPDFERNDYDNSHALDYRDGPVGGRYIEDHSEEIIPPPPPPSHRYAIMDTQIQSSPGYSRTQDDWNLRNDNEPPFQPGPSKRSIYGGRGHLASKSEVCLPSFQNLRRDVEPNDLNFYQQRHSYNSEYDHDSYDHDFNISQQPQSSQQYETQSPGQRSSMVSFRHDDRLELTNHDYDYPIRRGFSREDVYEPNDPHSMYRTSTQVQLPSHSPSSRSPPHSLNGSVSQYAQHTPTRPHPLSQQHTLSSSPHHTSSPYDGMPLIKPLAISPNKLKLNTSTSSERYSHPQERMSITRKSLSPLPLSSDPNSHFGTPYSPDSFDALNPALPSQVTESPTSNRVRPKFPSANSYKEDPIVDFHGNVVDPTDRLPETSWAPEPPKKDGKDLLSNKSSPAWARESITSNHDSPRKIKLRIGPPPDRPVGSRDADRPLNYATPGSSPANRASMYASSPLNSSPVDTSPSGRNRLIKKSLSRPQSMAPLSSWNQPIKDVPTPPMIKGSPSSYIQSAGPLVPAKIPLDSPRGSPNYGVSFTNDHIDDSPRSDAFTLSSGMQDMRLGNGANSVPRRVGGRRLLGFGG